jgi:hypothetical protein
MVLHGFAIDELPRVVVFECERVAGVPSLESDLRNVWKRWHKVFLLVGVLRASLHDRFVVQLNTRRRSGKHG